MISRLGLPGRFWDKVLIGEPDECWVWCSHISKKGYGRFKVGAKNISCARLVLEKSTGKTGECACHTCDFPACVNPNHLFWGTNADNISDSVRKGRKIEFAPHGERNQWSNHSDQKVKEFMDKYIAIKKTGKYHNGASKLCKEYGLTLGFHNQIIKGKSRRHQFAGIYT